MDTLQSDSFLMDVIIPLIGFCTNKFRQLYCTLSSCKNSSWRKGGLGIGTVWEREFQERNSLISWSWHLAVSCPERRVSQSNPLEWEIGNDFYLSPPHRGYRWEGARGTMGRGKRQEKASLLSSLSIEPRTLSFSFSSVSPRHKEVSEEE